MLPDANRCGRQRRAYAPSNQEQMRRREARRTRRCAAPPCEWLLSRLRQQRLKPMLPTSGRREFQLPAIARRWIPIRIEVQSDVECPHPIGIIAREASCLQGVGGRHAKAIVPDARRMPRRQPIVAAGSLGVTGRTGQTAIDDGWRWTASGVEVGVNLDNQRRAGLSFPRSTRACRVARRAAYPGPGRRICMPTKSARSTSASASKSNDSHPAA